MNDAQEWLEFAGQDAEEIQAARELRQRFMRERIQVSPEDPAHPSPQLRYVSRTSALQAEWWLSLSSKQKIVVRGAAAVRDTRKAVLIGIWAAAQWGMWFRRPDDGFVVMALPSGHQPSKSRLPAKTRFKSMKLREDEIVELDGVRVTHPLRTYLDLCRLGDPTNARLAVGWLRECGVSADTISSYAENFDGPIHPHWKTLAVRLPQYTAELGSFSYMLAYTLLVETGVDVRVQHEIEGMGWATLLVGNDVIIEIDQDPLWLAMESEPKLQSMAARLRKRERWMASRGYRKLYFTTEEIEANPDAFVHDVKAARHLRRRNLA